jgi:(1->4)-alpha-D-glucan 1-alpha-D-glucosylmutase
MVGALEHRRGLMPTSVPLATYRVQLTPDFGFDAAAAVVPYLKALGISHLYASPFLKARAGSSHGYDVVDHSALNPELGGEDAFARLTDALKIADIGLILDFVPNHMGVNFADNPWWLDVLEWGPKSPHAASFDIDWQTLEGHPRGGVLLPILGRSYGEALEAGEIELRYDAAHGTFSAWYYEHRLPIGPGRYGEILQKLVLVAGANDETAGQELIALAARHHGPQRPARDDATTFKRELSAIAGGADVIERGLRAYRPESGEPDALLLLHRLLERQWYRLAHWRLAGSEINYRRFFDINALAGLRVEDPGTFEAIHRRVRRLIAEGALHGLRLDHVDGLRDPHQYFRRLQRLVDLNIPPGWPPFYLVVEKILHDGEHLPRFAEVAGTTGYEWLNAIARLLLDENGLAALENAWQQASGERRAFGDILIEAKRRVIANILASEFTVLTRMLARIAAGHYSTRDYSTERLRAAFELIILHFPVYRTYIAGSGPSRGDRAIIDGAIGKARAAWFGADIGIFDFLRDVLTLDLIAPGRSGHSKARVRHFAFKVQQFTGPMMAKSLEDTAFYRYHVLLALNEVGGDPAARGLSIADFHHRMAERCATFPHGLTATATHDTKRGEDARARLIALTELAQEWEERVQEWTALNARLSDSSPRPSPAHEYMLYQALLGAWPLEGIDAGFVERMKGYALKAAREGKEQTSWLAPNEDYESGLTAFVERVLDGRLSFAFIESFSAFAHRIALIGALNSLSQLTLKATMPGIPDVYQGTEFWDLALVDPDNRRPVDFASRVAGLDTIGEVPDWQTLVDQWDDGRVKLALTRRLLALRRSFADLFTHGAYRPIDVSGPDHERIVAYVRSSGGVAVIVAVGRLFARATDNGRCWPDAGAWNATLTLDRFADVTDMLALGRKIAAPRPSVAELFGPLPCAILQARLAPAERKPARSRLRSPANAEVPA